MKYKCLNADCGESFLYAAKKTVEKTIAPDEVSTIEILTCPFCGSIEIDEAPQEAKGVALENIVSLKDVSPNEVDSYLAQGYVVYQTWQKNVFVVKLKPKETEQTTPAIQFDHVTMEDEQA